MILKDAYLTIADASEGEYKEKGSKFLAYAYPIEDESELDLYLSLLHDEHPKARHFCYAYKLGMDQNRYRANDDGEPSGTAGKPILGQILSFELTNVLIVVVRYFGGTKLGASGLIQAYKEAAKEALQAATIIEKFISVTYILTFEYEHMGHVMNVLKETNAEISYKSFEDTCLVHISVRQSMEKQLMHRIKAKLLQKSMEEVHVDTEVDFCKIEIHAQI
jgi:uncharacterized YigZ family protein